MTESALTSVGGMAGEATSHARAAALVALAACCFGAISILTVLATRDGLPLPAVLAWRYLLAVPPLLLLTGWGAMRATPRRAAVRLAALGGGGQAVVAFVTLSSLAYIPAATLGFLFYTFPAWVALFAALSGREPLTPSRALALLLSLGGVALMVGAPGAGTLHPAGVALALGGAVAYALYIPLLGALRGSLHPGVATSWVSMGAGAIFVAAAMACRAMALPPTATAWTAVLLLALVCTALAFIAFLRGLAVLGPVRTAIVSTVEPFCTAVLGALVLGQPIGPGVLLGGLGIAASVWLLQRKA